MKKKSAGKAKRSSSSSKKTKPVKSKPGRVLEMAARPQLKPAVQDDPRFAQAVENYEAALKAIQERKFDRAKGLLQKVMDGSSTELADRAAVHIKLCNQQMARAATAFKTPEEHYDF